MIRFLDELLIFGIPLYFLLVIIAIMKDLKVSWYKIILWLLILSCLCIAAYLWNAGKPEGFGLNLFTELLGIGLTLLIVELLLKGDRDRKQLPRKLILYNKLTAIICNYVGGLKTFFSHHVPSNIGFPDSIEDFLDHNFMQNLWTRIDLEYVDSSMVAGYEEGFTNTHGSRIESLSKYIISSYKYLLENYTDLILEEDDLFLRINKVINSGFLGSCANLSRNLTQMKQNTGDDQIGLGYIRNIDATELYRSIIYINNWSKSFYLKHNSDKHLHKPYEYSENCPQRKN